MSLRHCVPSILWYYSQALRLLQYVPTDSIDYEVSVSSSSTALGKFHLHLPGLDAFHRDRPRIQTIVHLSNSRWHMHCEIPVCLPSVESYQLVHQMESKEDRERGRRRTAVSVPSNALLGRSTRRCRRRIGGWFGQRQRSRFKGYSACGSRADCHHLWRHHGSHARNSWY